MIRSTSCIHSGRDRHQVDPARFEAIADERLGHREARAEQRHAGAAVGDQPLRRRIADVEHRHADMPGDRLIAFVNGVAGDHDAFRAALLEPLGGVHHDLGDAVPVAGELHRGDVREIEALDRQRGAVQPAQALRDAAIDMFVIKRGRRPAHAPDDTQLAQLAPLPLFDRSGEPLGPLVSISAQVRRSGKRVTAGFTSELNQFAPSRCHRLP